MDEQTTALTLPDEAQFRRDITAINKFQQVVHSCMIKDQDYGIIPGTTKPTLLKPGAEKIAKLLGLADQYEILDSKEDWQLPFFRYLIKARLVHIATGVIISEGMGECNSYESKYRYRWVGERDVPEGIDKSTLVSQERKSKQSGGHWTVYRMDNDDIYSQVNTILKMAKKRALVDAALSAGRLSDVFTQDIEDIPGIAQQEYTTEKPADRARTEPEVNKNEHYCELHGVNFFMRGKMKAYAHPIGDTGEWCHEHRDSKPANKPQTTPDAVTMATDSDTSLVDELYPPAEKKAPVKASKEVQPEEVEDRKVTASELADLKAVMGEKNKSMTWLSEVNKANRWGIKDMKDINIHQLRKIHEELGK